MCPQCQALSQVFRLWSLLLHCNFPQKCVGWLGVPHGAEEETEAKGPDFPREMTVPHASAQLSPSQTHPESRLGLGAGGTPRTPVLQSSCLIV